MRRMLTIQILVMLSALPLLQSQQINPAQDNAPKESGLYYQSADNYIKMQRSCNNGLKTHSFGARDEFVYKDVHANFQIDSHRPTFIFVGRDASPTVRHQFSLVSMENKKRERRVEFRVGGVISNALDLKTIRTGLVSTVTPISELNTGEYLLGVFEGVSDATVGNLTACGFDFSVK